MPEIVQDYPLDGYFLVYESKASVDFSQLTTSLPGTIPNSFQEKIPDAMPPSAHTIPESFEENQTNGENIDCPVQKQISTASSTPSNPQDNDGKLYYGDSLELADDLPTGVAKSDLLENIWEGDEGEEIVEDDQTLLESLLDGMHLFPQVYKNRQRDVEKCLIALKLFGKYKFKF